MKAGRQNEVLRFLLRSEGLNRVFGRKIRAWIIDFDVSGAPAATGTGQNSATGVPASRRLRIGLRWSRSLTEQDNADSGDRDGNGYERAIYSG